MFCRIITAILLAMVVNTSLASPSVNDPFVQKTIREFMDKTHAPGVAVAIVREGKAGVYVFGKADIDKNSPVTPDTIFEVGSVTKLFTGILLADDVVRHRLELTDNIAQMMPGVEKNWVMRRITLAQLASHTAGFPFTPPDSLVTSEDLKQYLLAWKPSSSEPVYQYSNIGIGLLGRILEAHDKKDLSQLYIDRILSPLHMSEIGFKVPSTLKPNYSQGYLATGKPTPHEKSDLFSAGYFLKMSINDFSKFLQASLHLKGVPSELSEAIKLSQTPVVQLKNFQQALGWQVNAIKNTSDLQKNLNITTLEPTPFKLLPKNKQKFNPKALIEKTGSTDGFRSYIALIPESKTGVAILTNRAIESDCLVSTARTLLEHNLKSKAISY